MQATKWARRRHTHARYLQGKVAHNPTSPQPQLHQRGAANHDMPRCACDTCGL